MSGEPIMPQMKFANPRSIPNEYSFGVYKDRGSHDIPVVVAPIDADSWRAMVERAAKVNYGVEHDEMIAPWRDRYIKEAAISLRAALNLPDGWTP